MTWRNAAANARLVFDGPTDPTPRAIWAGAFGWSDQTTTDIVVEADIDGTEITVDTAVAERWAHTGLEQRQRIAEAIWRHVIADDEPVTLPFAVAVEAEDRNIDVNGSPIGFNGVRVTGSHAGPDRR